MRVVQSPGLVKRLRRTAWEHQRTFQSPQDDLPRLVEAIMSALPGLVGAQAVIEQVVIEPRRELAAFSSKHALSLKVGTVIEAEGAAEARELLQAMLSEWVDFFFVPSPKPFVIYADHDDYITILAHRKGAVSAAASALKEARVQAVDYIRKF